MWVTSKFVNLKCTYQHVQRVEPFSAHIIVLIHGGTHDGDIGSIDAPHTLVDLVPFRKTNGCLVQLRTLKRRRDFIKISNLVNKLFSKKLHLVIFAKS